MSEIRWQHTKAHILDNSAAVGTVETLEPVGQPRCPPHIALAFLDGVERYVVAP